MCWKMRATPAKHISIPETSLILERRCPLKPENEGNNQAHQAYFTFPVVGDALQALWGHWTPQRTSLSQRVDGSQTRSQQGSLAFFSILNDDSKNTAVGRLW